VDTVANYDQGSGGGTGFVFHDLNPGSLADTIGGAVSTWYDRPEHIDPMRRRAMLEDHSWGRSAREYVGLYLAASARRRGQAFSGAPAAERAAPAVEGSPVAPLPVLVRGTGNRAARAQGGSRRARRHPTPRAVRRPPG